MTFRVTHIDVCGKRRRLRIQACSSKLAMAWAEQLFGDARYLAAICLGGVA